MRKEEICLYIDVQAYVRWVGKKRGGGGQGRRGEGVGREGGQGKEYWVGDQEKRGSGHGSSRGRENKQEGREREGEVMYVYGR